MDENNDMEEELENKQREGWDLWLYKLYNADIYFIQPMIHGYNDIDLFSLKSILYELIMHSTDEFFVSFSKAKMVINAKKLPWKNVSSSAMGGSKSMKFEGKQVQTKISTQN